MAKRDLDNPPLKEAIFEVKWDITQIPPNLRKDSQLVAGILLDKVGEQYPFHEPLEVSKMPIPEDAIAGVPQHRFRVSEASWPLLQVGVGVLTVNDTNEGEKYEWDDFKARCQYSFEKLTSFYPVSEYVSSVVLRYVNTIPFDYEEDNIFDFLKEKMGIELSVPPAINEGSNTHEKPSNFNFSVVYPCTKPNGLLRLFFSSGKNNGEDSLVWNIEFITDKSNVPDLSTDSNAWLDSVHSNIENTFFNLIKNLDDIIS